MHQDRTVSRGLELGRWLVVAALLVIGLALYLLYAPSSEPAARPVEHEGR